MAGLYTFDLSDYSLHTINRSTGVSALAVSVGAGSWFGLAWDGSNLYAINDTNDSLYTLNKDTGATTLVGSLGSGSWSNLAWDGSNLYTLNGTNDSLYRVNKDTGATTLVGSLGSGSWSCLAWDGSNLCTIDSNNGNVYRVDKNNGVKTLVGSSFSLGPFEWVGLESDGENLYVINRSSNSLFILDKESESLALVGSAGSLGSGSWFGLVYIPPASNSSSKIITLNSYTANVDDTNKVPDTDFTQVQASQDNRLRLLIPAKDQLTGSPASYVDNYLYIAIPQNRELANVYYDDDLTAPQRNNFSLFQNPSTANGNLKIYKSNTELADSFVNRLIVLELL